MKIAAIIGARPQFIKHYAIDQASKDNFELITIHTGQHYDSNMSDIFFNELEMSKPTHNLNIGSGNHGLQTANMIVEIEKILLQEQVDGLILYGDTNSTLAGSIVASKLLIPVFHIEAGLRSFNKSMPEEINRILTDHVSSILFVPSKNAEANLNREGITNNVYDVGDIMKDLILSLRDSHKINKQKFDFSYYYATIHRPYNTDEVKRLTYILSSLNTLDLPVVFSIHPRTKHLMETYNLSIEDYPNIFAIEPQSYFDNLNILNHCSGLITDSGGMQKEAYWLKKRCLTIRTETEWIETLEQGMNTLLFDNLDNLTQHISKPLDHHWNPELYGNGTTAKQIINHILKFK